MFPYQPLSETSTPLGASPPDPTVMKAEGQEEVVAGGGALTGQTEHELRERLLHKKMAKMDKSLDSQTGQAVPGPPSTGVVPSQNVSRDGEPDQEEGEVKEGVEESVQKSSKRPREEPTDRSPTGSKRSSTKAKRSKRHRDDHSDQSDSDDDRSYSRRRSSGRRHQQRSNSDRYSDYSDGSDNKGQSSSRRRGGDSRYSDSDHSDDNHRSYRDYYRSRSHRHYHSDDYSDDDRGSSKRSSRKRRSRSRSKEHRESYDSKSQRDKSSKKSKKDKKKRKHHHSSSDEEHDRSRSSGDRGKDSRDSRSFRSSSSKDTSRRSLSSREPSKPAPPQPPEKSFVPAKYKPKGKVREEPDELGNSAPLTPTQMQMLHSIASATGAYGPVSYPVMEQQYYYPTSYNPSATAYEASSAAVYPVSEVKPTETAVSEEEVEAGQGQEVHVPVLSPVAKAKTAVDSAPVEEKAAVAASAEISMEAVPTEEKSQEEEVEKEMASDNQKGEEIAECEMEVEEESPVIDAAIAEKPVEVAVEEPPPPPPLEEGAIESQRSPEQAVPVTLPPVEMRESEKDEESNLQAYKTTVLENIKSDIESSSSSHTSEPVSAIEVVAQNQTPPLVETKEEVPTAPAESGPPAEVVASSSPPAPSSMEEAKGPGDTPTPAAAPEAVAEKTSEALPTSSTVTATTSQPASTTATPATPSSTVTSSTPTSTPYTAYQQAYSYAQADPNQAYAAYAQAAMAYNNPAMAAYYPYQYGTAMYDPSQYAAAMNYYANYQAAYGAYGAYYQQGVS